MIELKHEKNYSACITFKTYKDVVDAKKNLLGSWGMKVECFPNNDTIRDQLQPIMTMICMSISFILGTTHTNSKKWIILVYFSRYDRNRDNTPILFPNGPTWVFWWFTTSPCKFTRILLCSFCQDLGKLLANHSAIKTFHSICIKLTATFIEENRVLYQRRTLNYDIGICYAELLAQAIATLVGYFSYPPIVNLALFAWAYDTL